MFLFTTVIILSSCLNISFCFDVDELFSYMTDNELNYYFKSENKNKPMSYEIVELPVVSERAALSVYEDDENPEDFPFNFEAFGEPFNLKLKRNSNLIPSNFKSFLVTKDNINQFVNPNVNCHYIHRGGNTTAAISVCLPNKVHGLLFMKNATLEILPLTQRLEALFKVRQPTISEGGKETIPHIIKRVSELNFHDEGLPVIPQSFKKRVDGLTRASNRPVGGLTAELALFFDAAAYNIFSPYMDYDDVKLQDMVLAYMNGVQALYHHPSLGVNLELVLVRLDIMKSQPYNLPHYDGERSKLLDSFCDYQDSINPKGDDNPDHWDMALYISGLDFFAYENGRKSGVTMGLATVGGVCLGKYACVIAELGTTNVFGKPYPSAGFTSVYILAHEIGHNLGMHHDSSGNNCPKEGFIMSPSRGTNGETQWSTCSADVMKQLSWASCLFDSGKPPVPDMDHKKFTDSPGQMYTSKKQCEILLRDKDAYMVPSQELSSICYNLQCKTPHRSGYYHSGPALEGTKCGNKKYCFGGECVNREPPTPTNIIAGGWSPWKTGSCRSGCILKSKGYQDKRRYCNNPAPLNTDKGCEGHSYEVGLCKDDKICYKNKKKAASEFASSKCSDFAKLLPQLDPKGAGLQAPHEEGRLWVGCAIFCRRAGSGSYYTPRIELNDLGVSPYFPDGTWCHSDNTGNYYCLQHHCLPEHFEFTKSFLYGLNDDIPIPQNAHPVNVITGGLQKYLSLSPDGKPLQTALKPGDTDIPKEEDWEINDYIELPDHLNSIGAEINFLNFMD